MEWEDREMKTGQKILVSIVALLAGSAILVAEPFGPPEGGQRGRPGDAQGMQRQQPRPPQPGIPGREQLERAGVDAAKIDELMALRVEQATKRIDLEAAVQKAELSLDHLMGSRTADEKAVEKAVDVLNDARSALFKHEVLSGLKVRALLGEEVLGKLRELGRPGPGPGQQAGLQGDRGPGQGPGPREPGQGFGQPRPPEGRQ